MRRHILDALAVNPDFTAVTQALEEYIQRRKQLKVLKLFGKIDYDPTYDYKKQRNRK